MLEPDALTREQIDSLADHIAQLSLRIDLAKHAFLTALRQFTAHEGWAGSGFSSAVAWLSWRTGISPTTAREYVRVAKALGEFPRIDAAFAAGQLSYAKVRAMTRAASPVTEEGLVDIAMHATAAQIETTCAAYRRTRIHPNASGDMQADLRRCIAPPRRAGWCASRCSCAPSRPRSCRRPCMLRSTLAARHVTPRPPSSPPRITSPKRALPRKRPGHALDELELARRWVDEHEGSLDAELLRMLERGPRSDGSLLDLRAALDWMFGAEQRGLVGAVN